MKPPVAFLTPLNRTSDVSDYDPNDWNRALTGSARQQRAAAKSARDEAGIVSFSEEQAALAFAAKQEGKMVWDHTAGQWFLFDKGKWTVDGLGVANDRARQFLRDLQATPGISEGERKAMGKLAFTRNVLEFAKSDKRIAVHQGVWDANPWLLGVPGGVVDLKTGKTRDAKPGEYISRTTLVAPAKPSSDPVLWRGFLIEATANDPETIAFLQRLCGYFLTGDVTEEMLAFLYGSGGNGKGVFVTTVTTILGGYAVAAPMDAFTADSRMNVEYYRARMAGSRLVTASETEAGRAWAESQIKELTGNEAPVSARQPYGRPFEYWPQYKLMFVGNHAPRLKGRSKAMERRLRIVPFDNEPAQPDHTLKTRLEAEYPAILQWMIEGCLLWQQQRLGTAPAIAAKTAEYFELQDAFGRWMGERCTLDAAFSARPGALYGDFRNWAKANGEHAPSNQEFAENINRHKGLFRRTVRGAHWVAGIKLKDLNDEATFPV
jgi:putative DNA primase/helicase